MSFFGSGSMFQKRMNATFGLGVGVGVWADRVCRAALANRLTNIQPVSAKLLLVSRSFQNLYAIVVGFAETFDDSIGGT